MPIYGTCFKNGKMFFHTKDNRLKPIRLENDRRIEVRTENDDEFEEGF